VRTADPFVVIAHVLGSFAPSPLKLLLSAMENAGLCGGLRNSMQWIRSLHDQKNASRT
jgi:hypothetical protein